MNAVTWDFHASGISPETFGKLVEYLVSANPDAKYDFERHVNGVKVLTPEQVAASLVTAPPATTLKRPNALVQLSSDKELWEKEQAQLPFALSGCDPTIRTRTPFTKRRTVRAVVKQLFVNGFAHYCELEAALIAAGFKSGTLSYVVTGLIRLGHVTKIAKNIVRLTDNGRAELVHLAQ